MAKLIKCKSCGYFVVETAKTCPGCGIRNPGITGVQVLLSVFILIIMVYVFIWPDEEDKKSLAPSENNSSYISMQKERIKSKLKDPSSAEFSDVFVSKAIGVPIVCGRINAKNSFGGYTGFQRFISGGTIQVTELEMAAGEMDKTWSQTCGQ